MNLSAEIIKTEDLTKEDSLAMFGLLASHFDGVSWTTFQRDLAEKTWVISLRDRVRGDLAGFSTLMLLQTPVEGVSVTAVFSGDTIINQSQWGDAALAQAWLKFVFDLMTNCPGERLYWFLISQGHRTYRFLPIYFYEFFPRRGNPTPVPEQKVLDTLASTKFRRGYDPATGVIRLEGCRQRLKPALSTLPPGRLKNPDIAFFVERNPGHGEGDELVCIAPLRKDNFKPIAFRLLNWSEGRAL